MKLKTKSKTRLRPRVEFLEGRALLTAGTLDPTFGGTGLVTTPTVVSTAIGPEASTALYPLSDPGDPTDAGKIVVVGPANDGTRNEFAVMRYNPDGSPDTSFGGTGSILISFNGLVCNPRAVAIQADGKILVGGMSGIAGKQSYDSVSVIARLDPNGTLDTGFGNGGWVTSKPPVSKSDVPWETIDSLAIEPNGEILAAGNAETLINGVWENAVFLDLYKSNGQLDTFFGKGGIVYTSIGSGNQNDIIYDVGLQTVNGTTKIIAAGMNNSGSNTGGAGPLIGVIRFNLNGVLNTSFGANGVATLSGMKMQAGAIQPDGAIVVAGYQPAGRYVQMALARFTASGVPDLAFGQGGEVQTLIAGTVSSTPTSVTVQPDGAIVAAGWRCCRSRTQQPSDDPRSGSVRADRPTRHHVRSRGHRRGDHAD